MNPRSEEGSVTLMLVVMVTALLVAVGLVVDGGAKLRAVEQATAVAGEAARAATQQVNVAQVQSAGSARLDSPAARRAAQDTLAEAGVDGSVTVSSGRVVISAHVTRPTVFLSVVGIPSVSGSASATADLTIR